MATEIKVGCLYMNRRSKRIAKVHDYIEGVVVLDWEDSGRQSNATVQYFLRSFTQLTIVDISDKVRIELEEDTLDICPECGNKSVKAKWSGVECITPDCGYWFCL